MTNTEKLLAERNAELEKELAEKTGNWKLKQHWKKCVPLH